MSIEDIKADELIIMTENFHRLFKAGGCTPCCHYCKKWLEPNTLFKLSTVNITSVMRKRGGNTFEGAGAVETMEVMLCEVHTAKQFNKRTKEKIEEYEEWQEKTGGGCFRINGKIIH